MFFSSYPSAQVGDQGSGLFGLPFYFLSSKADDEAGPHESLCWPFVLHKSFRQFRLPLYCRPPQEKQENKMYFTYSRAILIRTVLFHNKKQKKVTINMHSMTLTPSHEKLKSAESVDYKFF